MDNLQPPKPKVIHRRPRGRPRDPILIPPAKLLRKQRKADILAREGPVNAILRLSHTRNGIVYGPGAVTLPRGLLMELQHDEEQAIRVEEQFRGTKAAIIVTEDGKVREVPPETFDTSLNNAEPAIRQKGSL